MVGSETGVLAVHEDTIISGSHYGEIKLWTFEGECVKTIEAYSNQVCSLAVHNDLIISGSKDIKIWTMEGECVKTLEGHSWYVRALAVHKDTIISGSYDKTIKCWTLEGECIRTLKGHSNSVLALAVHKDIIISGMEDYTIKLWSHGLRKEEQERKEDKRGKAEATRQTYEKHTVKKTLKGILRMGTPFAVLNDLIISLSTRKIKIWTLEGECVKTIEGHSNAVLALAVHENYIISGSWKEIKNMVA